jgi:NADH-quinone oxidoreductase subunit J
METALFFIFAVAVLLAASAVIFLKNPVGSAMSLVACFFFLAGIYVLLWAHTIAAIQVLVYAGAIMVLFLFVIMLLNISDEGPLVQLSPSRVGGAIASAGLFAALAWVLVKLPSGASLAWQADPAQQATFGTINHLGSVLYTQWLFPFEAVSLLLLVAILGAVVVAKPRI